MSAYSAGMEADLSALVATSVLPEAERLHFLDLCRGMPADELLAQRARILDHLNVIDVGARTDGSLDSALAQRIGGALLALVDDANDWTFEQRRLLAGAIEYFVAVDDTVDDYRVLGGLEDDARVISAVCRALGHPEKAIVAASDE
jgi:hypothetical protein